MGKPTAIKTGGGKFDKVSKSPVAGGGPSPRAGFEGKRPAKNGLLSKPNRSISGGFGGSSGTATGHGGGNGRKDKRK